MRKVVLFAPALLSACAIAPPAPPMPGGVPGQMCDATGTERFIGQPRSDQTGAAIVAATHSTVLRWAPMGYMMTMEFRADRVTVRLGPDSRVLAINCG